MILQNHGLQAFKAIVEAGTVHSAAAHLGLTQTAVTQRLKSLEADLKLTLFLRSRRGMTLTADGAALLQYCRASEELEGVFLSRVRGESRDSVELTIVGPTSAISTRVIADCESLYAKYPHLRLHFRSDDHSRLLDLVRKGDADLAIVGCEDIPNEMDSKVLKPERYLLVGSAKWKGRKLSDILESERIIDFFEDDSTTLNYLKTFKLSARRQDRVFVNENRALIRLFASGVGFGTLTESVARKHIEAEELIVLNKGQAMEDPLALVWYSRTQKQDYFSDLIRLIK